MASLPGGAIDHQKPAFVLHGYEGDDGGDNGYLAELVAMAAASAMARAGDPGGSTRFAEVAQCVRFWRDPVAY